VKNSLYPFNRIRIAAQGKEYNLNASSFLLQLFFSSEKKAFNSRWSALSRTDAIGESAVHQKVVT